MLLRDNLNLALWSPAEVSHALSFHLTGAVRQIQVALTSTIILADAFFLIEPAAAVRLALDCAPETTICSWGRRSAVSRQDKIPHVLVSQVPRYKADGMIYVIRGVWVKRMCPKVCMRLWGSKGREFERVAAPRERNPGALGLREATEWVYTANCDVLI